jgi:hypothetical protein
LSAHIFAPSTRKVIIMKKFHPLTVLTLAGCFVILPTTAFAAPEKKQGHEKQKISRPEVRIQNPPAARTSAEASRRSEATRKSTQVRQMNRQDKPRVVPQQTLTTTRTRTPEPRKTTTTTNRRPATTLETRDRSRPDNDRNRVSEKRTPTASPTNRRTVVNNRTVIRQAPRVRVSTQQHRYNRTNRYGGLWFSANTHSGWNRNRQYSYNNRQYRWYDGGWLIINAGYSPDYSYAQPSMESLVQSRLAELGYYRGPIDGDIGSGSRRAIANYQDAHDLRVTATINDPLLRSLDLI